MTGRIQVSNKDIVWNYLGYGMTFGINVILLPLVLRFLPTEELGLWYVFVSIGALTTLFDFGFAPQVARTFTYVFSGAPEILKTGVSAGFRHREPNYSLLNKLIASSKLLYLSIAFLVLLLLLGVGLPYIKHINNNMLESNVLLSWLIFCVGCFINLSYSYYNSLFRGIGRFVSLNKAIVISRTTQFVFSFILLLLGFGILAVSIAYTVNTIVFRFYLAYVYKKEGLNPLSRETDYAVSFSEKINLVKTIGHNASKDGLVIVSNYLVTQSNTIVCSLYFGLEKTASYALSVQIITFIVSFSTIVFSTYQPLIVESTINQNMPEKKRLYSFSWTVFVVTFVVFVLSFVLLAVPFLTIIRSNTQIELGIFVLYAVYMLFQTNTNLSASYISASNKIPYAKSFFFSSVIALILSVLFAEFTELGVPGLIFSHIVVQLAYNVWKWPIYVFKELKTNPVIMIKDSIAILLNKFGKYERT